MFEEDRGSTRSRPGGSGLLAAAVAGSEEAFDSLFRPLVDPGYRLAMVMLRSPRDAEDAVQEAILEARQRLRRLRDEGTLRPWFLAIVAGECRSWRRRRWWPREALPELRGAGSDESVVRSAELARAFARLGAEDRLAIFLFYWMDLPLDDLARVMGRSVPAARSRLHRALRRMRPDRELSEVVR
jgi:RNA polymerase sigma-70 factor (ECF subfamily)